MKIVINGTWRPAAQQLLGAWGCRILMDLETGPDGGCPLGLAAHGEVHAILVWRHRGGQRCRVLWGAALKTNFLMDTELKLLVNY